MPENGNNRNADRLVHLMLRESRGGRTPPDLSKQILGAIDGKAPVRRLPPVPKARGFSPWLAAAASIALIAALVAGAFAFSDGRKAPPPPETPSAERKPAAPPKTERREEAPTPEPSRDPQPLPAPEPQPLPEPQPEPEPVRPEAPDVVERPEPEPSPQPTPEPDPAKDPVIEKPVKDPVVEEPAPLPEVPPTEVPRETTPHAKLGALLFASEKARLTWRADANDKWKPWDQPEVLSGMQFKARAPVGLQLSDGARLFFDGEIALTGDARSVSITLEDDSLYLDCYGSLRGYTVQRRDAAFALKDAEVLAERSGSRLQVSCLGGEIIVGETALAAGWSAPLTANGFGRAKFEGNKIRAGKLVAAVDAALTLMRDDLGADSARRLYAGEISDGVVLGKSPGAVDKCAFGIEFERPITTAERAYIRMRIRVTGSEGLSLGFSGGEEKKWRYFQSHHNHIRNGEWIVLRVPLSALMDEAEKVALGPGVKLTKFQIVLWKAEGATIEVDWFELGIDPEQENK